MKEDTAQHILDVAQDLLRQRGYSAFSYADIAAQVGVRKASIHYHFPTKEELVKALVQRYRDRFHQQRQHIQQTVPAAGAQLMQFAQLYRAGLAEGQICLCGMLTADFEVLSQAVRTVVQAFWADNEAWLAAVLTRGQAAGVLTCRSAVAAEAQRVLAILQGAQLMARAAGAQAPRVFDQIVQPLWADLGCDC